MGLNKEDFEKLNMRGIVISSMMTAFGLVVALAWKDTINATVAYLMPDNNDGTLQGMYVTAIAVTALVMGLAMLVLKLNARVEKEIERVQSFFDDEDEEDSKESYVKKPDEEA
jgi:multisubunit Na+/H+ antiporter MnhC subunit